MDNLTKEQRSLNMSRIRSTGTQLEKKFFDLLTSEGISFNKYPKIYGKPDCQIGENLLVFVDSDFWHGWNFSRWKDRMPKKYWVGKIENNIRRDRNKIRNLRRRGYVVLRVWEHQLKNPYRIVSEIKKLIK